MDVKIELKSFKTIDGGDTLEISPAGTRRKIRSWYIWVKEDGSGILVTQNGTRLELPENQSATSTKVFCTDSVCPLMNSCRHEFGKGCRLY